MSETHPIPVVVGTAGHIDHGKSALVEALCGVHPDRWAEEQERGITMDLGYAELLYEDGLEIGFVDVPGHEKLVRKMVAGATGMGAVLLVVACDDGVMPQTREHFEVLQLLGVEKAFIVLTKADLADEETRLLVEEDVRDLLLHTPWQGAPSFCVSAHSGEGIPELKEALRALVQPSEGLPEPEKLSVFRMPIQRSFALHGAGTVATGVCAGGSLSVGEELSIFPGDKVTRVRRIQVHGRVSESAVPGLRTALNLPDFHRSDCGRGVVLAPPHSLQQGCLLRLSVEWLASAPTLKHGGAIQVLSGTASLDGRVFLPPETSQVVEIELAEPVSLALGDRILLRRPSPATNLGLARFLGFGKYRLRKKDSDERKPLEDIARSVDCPQSLLSALLDTFGSSPQTAEALSPALAWRPIETLRLLRDLCKQGKAREVQDELFIGMGGASTQERELASAVASWKAEHPHRLRIPVQYLRDQLGKETIQSLKKAPAEELLVHGLEKRPGVYWGLAGAQPPQDVQATGEVLLAELIQAGLQPPALESLAPTALHHQAIEWLRDAGQVVCFEDGFALSMPILEELRALVVSQLQGDGIDIPTLRDHFHTSRKYMVPALEWLDDCGVTQRRAGKRILRQAEAPLVQ